MPKRVTDGFCKCGTPTPAGGCYVCPACDKEYKRLYYQRNKQKHCAREAARYLANPEKQKAQVKRWRLENKERFLETRRNWAKTRTIEQKLKSRLRSRIIGALKHREKSASTQELLGCSMSDLRKYLESKFQPGMTWENRGFYGWHIDHIIPLASFDLSDSEQQRKACHYTNLQPLWAKDNWLKADKVS